MGDVRSRRRTVNPRLSVRPHASILNSLFRLAPLAAILAFLLVTAGGARAASPVTGHFESNGKPVDEFHCEPATPGKHPAVILLHGAAPKGAALDTFQQMCSELADHGYYAMVLEYYSQTEVVGPGQPDKMVRY